MTNVRMAENGNCFPKNLTVITQDPRKPIPITIAEDYWMNIYADLVLNLEKIICIILVYKIKIIIIVSSL